jgi:hypothetical protein
MFCKKGMAIFLTAVCLCMSFSVSASAETTPFFADDVAPAYEIAYNVTSSLSISGNTAYCTSKSDGINAVRITVVQAAICIPDLKNLPNSGNTRLTYPAS